MNAQLQQLMKQLGHSFQDESYLLAALSHRSFQLQNNERLEFLGDSIVNFVIAEALYQQFPSAREGDLSRLRANLVRGETLAEIAQQFELGNYLLLGTGELKSGGKYRSSILADAVEAIIAAIYLDAGLEKCRACVLSWFQQRLLQQSLQVSYKDPKSRLQEYLQGKQYSLPQYEIVKVEGEAHAQIFFVECQLNEHNLRAVASGSSRRRAEQAAAEMMLEKLEIK
ncbi:MAG: ribonuclease III [Legionellales bacterium]|nr:ribonuclease III [Legionellales bacterium]